MNTMSTVEVLTPQSPRWNGFCNRLAQAMHMTDESWHCDGDGPHVHRYAKQIMAEMGGIDVPASLAFFESRGGYCDCEILFNVDDFQALTNLTTN
jgi:hypothetical protein